MMFSCELLNLLICNIIMYNRYIISNVIMYKRNQRCKVFIDENHTHFSVSSILGTEIIDV